MELDGGHFADDPFDEEIDVREDDERRSQGGTRVVLDYQRVALELPVDVAVTLHFREGGAGWTQRRQRKECRELKCQQSSLETD